MDPDAPPLRELLVDLDDLAMALDDHMRGEHEWYLDLKTGAVTMTHEDVGFESDEDNPAENEERFEWIPQNEPSEGYRLMEGFVSRVKLRSAQDKLSAAIAGKGAFRRFKDTLFAYPELRDRWFEFEARIKRQWAAEWLEGLSIRSTWQPPKPEKGSRR